MSSQPTTRAVTILAAALLLGGAFVVGTAYSGRQANAADVSPTLPTPGGSSATGTPQGITVTGTSEVAGKPDTLQLSMSVTAQASSVSKALQQANAAAGKVQSALRARGVAAKDLQTSDLQIQPNYQYPSGGQAVLDGYVVTESLTAQLRDLGTAGEAITAAVAAGGNAARVDGVSLDLEDNGSLVSAARDKAVADARAKAQQYAKALGRTLGAALSLTESVSTAPPVDYSMRADVTASKAMPVPIAAGSQTVSVSVTVAYAFGA
jgi:uncharacterized protein YggE